MEPFFFSVVGPSQSYLLCRSINLFTCSWNYCFKCIGHPMRDRNSIKKDWTIFTGVCTWISSMHMLCICEGESVQRVSAFANWKTKHL